MNVTRSQKVPRKIKSSDQEDIIPLQEFASSPVHVPDSSPSLLETHDPPSTDSQTLLEKVSSTSTLLKSSSLSLPQKLSLSSSNLPQEAPPSKDPTFKAEEEPKSSKRKYRWREITTIGFFLAAEVITSMVYSLMAPFFPEEARNKGASPTVIGAIVGSSSLIVVIISPLVGYIFNFIGLRFTVMIGLILIGSSCTILGFVDLIPINWLFILVAFLTRIMEGVGTAMHVTATYVVISTLYPNSIGTIMGFLQLSGGLGFSLGFPAGGILYDLGGFQLPFIVLGVPTLLITVPCVLLLGKMNAKKKETVLPMKMVWKFMTDGMFVLVVVSFVLVISALSFIIPILAPYLIDEFHFTPTYVGFTLLIIALTYLFSTLPFGIISDKLRHQGGFIIGGLLLVTLGYFIISIPVFTGQGKYWYIAVGFVIVGLGCSSVVVPAYPFLLDITWKYARSDEDKAIIDPFVSGVISASNSLGEFAGSMLGGFLNTYMSFPLITFLFAEVVLSQAVLILAFSLIRKFV